MKHFPVIRMYYKTKGGYVHVNVFGGRRESPNLEATSFGKNGDLVFTLDEWEVFKEYIMKPTNNSPKPYPNQFELIEKD